MAAKQGDIATTVRIESKLHEALRFLKEHGGGTVNDLVARALREFVARRLAEIEAEGHRLAQAARALRDADPDYRQGADEFVRAELELEEDPAEGRPYRGPVRRPAPPEFDRDDILSFKP